MKKLVETNPFFVFIYFHYLILYLFIITRNLFWLFKENIAISPKSNIALRY